MNARHETTPAPVTRGEGQTNQTPRSYAAPESSSSARAQTILHDLLDQAYREFLRDPRRDSPDRAIALHVWRRRRAEAFAAFQKHLAPKKVDGVAHKREIGQCSPREAEQALSMREGQSDRRPLFPGSESI